jgi:hypothetical protein
MSTLPHKSKERMVAKPQKQKRALCIHESSSRSEGPTLRRPGVINCLVNGRPVVLLHDSHFLDRYACGRVDRAVVAWSLG